LPSTKASGGSSANDSDGHETGAKRKRATCETSDEDAGVKKKSATVKTEEEYTYDAYEKFKPTRVRNKTSDVRLPVGNSLLSVSSYIFLALLGLPALWSRDDFLHPPPPCVNLRLSPHFQEICLTRWNTQRLGLRARGNKGRLRTRQSKG